ncbi:hypothetical protein F9B16_43920 [Actinomadura montaniterrae]|uniref:Uncharacterized protein n=2 Tax=Actinomadura montaniterrae TaxID=1803903 RepID=A0A6L3VMM0_9ACTN|nr:hypothetical protein F9B16_43920 [Actinomadura montaniterrae]
MAALGAAARRPVTMLGIAVLQVVLWTLPAAAGTEVAGWTDAVWPGFLANAMVWAVVCWSMLAVPVSVLDDCGAVAGLRSGGRTAERWPDCGALGRWRRGSAATSR